MLTLILLSAGIIFIMLVLLVIFSCFIVSGRISEVERQNGIDLKE